MALTYACSSGGCSFFFPSNDTSSAPTTAWMVHDVRVDTIGYLRSRAKIATVVQPAGSPDLSNAVAQIFDISDVPVWSCALGNRTIDPDSGLDTYAADFTGLDGPGLFYLAVPSIDGDPTAATTAPLAPTARSAQFEISETVFNGALAGAMTGLYGQRCGTAVSITMGADTWQHATCHPDDGFLDYLTGDDTRAPGTGGWHDAGDYGKYVNNGAFSVGMLLAAWEHFTPALAVLSLPIPEHGQIPAGGTAVMPDFLWEVKWELDWLLRAQQASGDAGGGGGLPDKVSGVNFESYGTMPERDNQRRYFSAIGTAMTANVVAVMAAAARIYPSYDPDSAGKYLAAAQLGYAFLGANAGPAVAANDNPKDAALVFETGHYFETDPDNRLWAAAEMWETTGDPGALADFEARAPTIDLVPDFDWPNVQNLGFYTYLLSQRSDKDLRDPTLVATLSTDVMTAADGLVATAAAHPFGRALGSNYYWGSNGSTARTAMLLTVANRLVPDSKYLDTIQLQLDHLLGRNLYDRSQVTMLGYHPPMNPHHGPSSGDGIPDPWPGLLVGGANHDKATTSLPAALTWEDVAADYTVNEIAINWVAAFVYATAALTPAPM